MTVTALSDEIAAFFMVAISLTQRALPVRTAVQLRIEEKLDLLLEHAGLKYVPHANLPAPVIEALRSNDRVLAIKRYRKATGLGLKEAMDAVGEIMVARTGAPEQHG